MRRSDSGLLWWSGLVVVSVAGLLTRVYNIQLPGHVTWDEAHFGKMAGWYINRTLFFDVHPPLGKMLVTLGGVLSGYDGRFPFTQPGEPYTTDVPYESMRLFCCMFAVVLIPLSYIITWKMSHSLSGSILSAALLICDTGLLTLSRYILLDQFLLCFIFITTASYLHFTQLAHRAFCMSWWFWLSVTGVSLAAAISVKFVGLFIVLLIGLSTAHELWSLLGNLCISMVMVLKHFLARVLCLILLPVAFYLAVFYVHLCLLNKSGTGDGFFSSAFQSQLIGNDLHNTSMPLYVAYGSVVTVKNHRTGGNYLHSHPHLYPPELGIVQQQVTAYAHKDENNLWLIKEAHDDWSTINQSHSSVHLLHYGDLVRLEHVQTRRNLHSHEESAPLTRRHFQVSCYGENGTGDSNDIFRVEKPGRSATLSTSAASRGREPVRVIHSVFSLVHLNVGCSLHSHDKQLPKWGWEQLEVTCNPRSKQHMEGALWNFEYISDARLETYPTHKIPIGLLDSVLEFHTVMIRGNRGLKPKEGEFTSLPWQWPINYKGQPFSGGDHIVYLLGNPIVWWLSIATTLLGPLFALVRACVNVRIAAVRQPESSSSYTAESDCKSINMSLKTTSDNSVKSKPIGSKSSKIGITSETVGTTARIRNISEAVGASSKQERPAGVVDASAQLQGSSNDLDETGSTTETVSKEWLLCGWLMHYAPFYFMSRVLYFHHYFPALIYSLIYTGIVWDQALDWIATSLIHRMFCNKTADYQHLESSSSLSDSVKCSSGNTVRRNNKGNKEPVSASAGNKEGLHLGACNNSSNKSNGGKYSSGINNSSCQNTRENINVDSFNDKARNSCSNKGNDGSMSSSSSGRVVISSNATDAGAREKCAGAGSVSNYSSRTAGGDGGRCVCGYFHTAMMVALLSVLIYSYQLFSPLAYGVSSAANKRSDSTAERVDPHQLLNNLRWLQSWDF